MKSLCRKCQTELRLGVNWYAGSKAHWIYLCKTCLQKDGRRRYEADPAGRVERSYRWRQDHPLAAQHHQQKYRQKLKIEVLGHYSPGFKCQSPDCAVPGGMGDMRVLSIDHIGGGGTKHVKDLGGSGRINFYAWLKNTGFPTGYQVLCMNCQWVKRFEMAEFRR